MEVVLDHQMIEEEEKDNDEEAANERGALNQCQEDISCGVITHEHNPETSRVGKNKTRKVKFFKLKDGTKAFAQEEEHNAQEGERVAQQEKHEEQKVKDRIAKFEMERLEELQSKYKK